MGNVILVLIDFSDVTDLVLSEAAKLGKALQSPIRLMHGAAPMIPPDFGEFGLNYGCYAMQEYGEELQEELDEIRDKLAAMGLKVSTLLFHGSPVDVIVEEAERLNPELVVLGSHGHGTLHHVLSGNVCQRVLRRVTCPVVIVPSRMATPAAATIQAAAPETSATAT